MQYESYSKSVHITIPRIVILYSSINSHMQANCLTIRAYNYLNPDLNRNGKNLPWINLDLSKMYRNTISNILLHIVNVSDPFTIYHYHLSQTILFMISENCHLIKTVLCPCQNMSLKYTFFAISVQIYFIK